MKIDALSQARLWAQTLSSDKPRWYRFWHRGYVQALKDIQVILDDDCPIVIMSLSEYKAIEGYYE
jgi:hypothetical protein